MRLVFGLVMLVGIALAGAAVYMARDYIGQQQAQLAAAEAAKKAIVPVKDVYVVNKQMRYGQRLTKKDVKKVRWPTSAIPDGAFTSEDNLFPDDGEELRSILRTIEPDEAILASKVTRPGEDAGVSSRLEPGKRAFAIKTDVTSGVGGFLRPGDRVDVYWTGKFDGGNITRLIQPNMRLIAINQSADEDRNSPIVAKTVTVQATATEVGALAQAQATGRLSLSLVGADDETVSASIEVDQQELLGIEQVVRERVKKCFINQRNGDEVKQIQVACPSTN